MFEVIEFPEPRKKSIKIFGVDAILQERTAEERRNIEKAFADRNGVDGDMISYALTFKIIESAFVGTLRLVPKIRFIKWYKAKRYNRLFTWDYLRDKLAESQIIFLIDEINKLDYGEAYEEIKKKWDDESKKKVETKPKAEQGLTTKQSED